MASPPLLAATFTLLYADPSFPAQRPFLQPLYGLTAPRGRSRGRRRRKSEIEHGGGSAHAQEPSSRAYAGFLREHAPEEIGPQPVCGGAALPCPGEGLASLSSASPAPLPSAGYFSRDGEGPLLASVLAGGGAGVHPAPFPCPTARSGHLLLSCAERRSLLLHGGLERGCLNDTWEFDVAAGRWTRLACAPLPAPPPDESEPDDDIHEALTLEVMNGLRWNGGPIQRPPGGDPGRPKPPPTPPTMPPCAFGQAGALYHDEEGRVRLFVMGGIQVEIADYSSDAFSLDLETQKWEELPLTLRLPRMWGSVAQTLFVDDADPAGEEVVVLFGGMAGNIAVGNTYLLHLSHRLTAEEVFARSEFYLQTTGFDAGALRRKYTAENARNFRRNWTVEECREPYQDLEEKWKNAWLRNLVGRYHVEVIPCSDATPPGRRRASSATFSRYFMFIFGGRDDFSYYNDFWVFNAITRMWVQLREEVQTVWVQKFFHNPFDSMPGRMIQNILGEVRRRKLKWVEENCEGALSVRQNKHNALHACPQNSSAESRTGSCMAVDVRRRCVYVFGGFTQTKGAHITFADLHAYYIDWHLWRSVEMVSRRPWEPHMDADDDIVRYSDPLRDLGAATPEEPDSPSETSERHDYTVDPTPLIPLLRTALCAPSTPCFSHHLRPAGEGEGGESARLRALRKVHAQEAEEARRTGLIAPRGMRRVSLPPSTAQGLSPDETGRAIPGEKDTTAYFRLPVLRSEPRTMAAFAPDPIQPGLRFFLHGGRAREKPCGDLFDVRLTERTALGDVYQATQKALSIIRQEKAHPPCPIATHHRKLKKMTAKDLLRHLQWQCLATARADFAEGKHPSSPPTTRASSLRGASLAWLRDTLEAPRARGGGHAIVLQPPNPTMELNGRIPASFSLPSKSDVCVDPDTWDDEAATREYKAHAASASLAVETLERVFSFRNVSPQRAAFPSRASREDVKPHSKGTSEGDKSGGVLGEIRLLGFDIDTRMGENLSDYPSWSPRDDPPEDEARIKILRRHYLLQLLNEVVVYQKCVKIVGNHRKRI